MRTGPESTERRSKMKLFFATLFAKLAYIALRILGRNASHFPGAVALKLCPDYLSRVKK